MDNWLRVSLLTFCLAQFFETGMVASAYSIRPDSLQTNGNGTNLMPGSEWRKDKMSCKAKQFTMELGNSTCEKKTIKNHYCLGFCNSLYIPQYPQSYFKVCKACLPTAEAKMIIAVNCMQDGKKIVALEEVTIIEGCKCVEVEC